MATIKRAGERIITKVTGDRRRVSCSCCPQVDECCIYPASCGEGPVSINFYGDALEKNQDSLSYGDLQNGVFLEGAEWAVYRNGNRSTKSCLGLGLNEQQALVEPNLASSYGFAFTWQGTFVGTRFYSGSLTFGGVFFAQEAPCGGDGLPLCGLLGQCGWSGNITNVSTQDFDEGIALIFNAESCRWEAIILAAGSDVLAFKEGDQSDPRGEYAGATSDPVALGFTIS
jgi:hypothetical protein